MSQAPVDPLLEQLCRERYGSLVALATMLTGRADAGPDLVHEAIVAVFGKRRSFPSLNSADAYVRTAIASRYIDAGKKAANQRVSEQRFAAHVPASAPEPQLADAELARALGLLPPRVRACVVLRFVEDLSITQTALALNLSEGAVKRYVSDGLAVLNQQLGTQAEPSTPPRISVITRRGQS
jgi:RNA polymerase sigma factor (sigma-70 family)